MNSRGFAWESLLQTDAPPGSSLKAALFTTYDRADERLLVEHFLPLLLRLGREPDGEGVERKLFLLELDRRLQQLHDKLVVVSSLVHEDEEQPTERGAGTYGWIWRYIRHLTVGSQGRAIQHAKLWLLHWGAADDGPEWLEIVVSSANLTMSAFKGQLQAAWRACVALGPRPADARLRTWGVLPGFVQELAASAAAKERLEPFLELLARVECPEGVSFVASVPGTHSRRVLQRTPWGAAGLRVIAPRGRGTVTASILSPYVGAWTEDALRSWCASFEGSTDRVELVWIDDGHPWSRAGRWRMSSSTLEALTKTDATLLHLGHGADASDDTDQFHEEHRAADERWSHAKVYSLRRGMSRRLLVTSANFSPAAWGRERRDGGLTIENFELGVCLEGGGWPFDELAAFEDPSDAATVADAPATAGCPISWAQAVWDGRVVLVECRCEPGLDVDGKVKASEWMALSSWEVEPDGGRRSASLVWALAKEPPSVAALTCGEVTLTVPVFDARCESERELAIPSEVDEHAAQWLRDQLLFEQYGGRITDDGESGDETEDTEDEAAEASDGAESGGAADEGDGRRPDSYAVPAFVQARRHLGVVDCWAHQLERATTQANAVLEREWLVRDGKRLLEAFKRQAMRDQARSSGSDLGAKLAAEELALRLEHLPEA